MRRRVARDSHSGHRIFYQCRSRPDWVSSCKVPSSASQRPGRFHHQETLPSYHGDAVFARLRQRTDTAVRPPVPAVILRRAGVIGRSAIPAGVGRFAGTRGRFWACCRMARHPGPLPLAPIGFHPIRQGVGSRVGRLTPPGLFLTLGRPGGPVPSPWDGLYPRVSWHPGGSLAALPDVAESLDCSPAIRRSRHRPCVSPVRHPPRDHASARRSRRPGSAGPVLAHYECPRCTTRPVPVSVRPAHRRGSEAASTGLRTCIYNTR